MKVTLCFYIYILDTIMQLHKLREILLSPLQEATKSSFEDFDVLFEIFHNNFIGIRTELLTPLPRTSIFKN